MSEFAENGNWDEDFKGPEEKNSNGGNNEGQRKLDWMKFPEKGEYRVRLCGKFVRFHRWWSPFTSRVITHISYKDQDPAWNAGFWPRKTFAIHVIDRNDVDAEHPTGKLKILEKGSSIFEAFANFKRINKIDPAGKQGPDFVITVNWPGNNKRAATYTVTATQGAAEWTQQELEMVKRDHADLKKIYAPTPLEKIVELWDALPEDAKVPPKSEEKNVSSETSTPAPPMQETPPVETVAVDDADDLFGDDDSTGF